MRLHLVLKVFIAFYYMFIWLNYSWATEPLSPITEYIKNTQCNIENISKQQHKSNPEYFEPVNFPPNKSNNPQIPQSEFDVIDKTPHDKTAFTQGLVFYQNYLYESIGLLGSSEIRKTDIKTGRIIKNKKLSTQYFAEGLALLKNQLVQFTLKKNTAFIYNVNSLDLLRELTYKGDVWGAVGVDSSMLLSDGTEFIRWIDPIDFSLIKSSQVLVGNRPLKGINELEFINGMLYANVWPTDCIAIIEPVKFQVVAWINLSEIYKADVRVHSSAVLNGIAYQPDENVLFVTGKNWPFIYHIKLKNYPTTD